MENFFSLRFFVAPILSLLFIMTATPGVFADRFIGTLESSFELQVAVLFVLMSGFLLAAVAAFLINVFKLDVIQFDAHELELLQTRYPFMSRELKRKNNSRELAEWLIMEENGSEYVREQVQARWSLFVVYFTSFLALAFIVLPVVMLKLAAPSMLWWGVYVLFVGIFFFNSWYFFRSVNNSIRLMLRRIADPHDVPTIVH